MWFYWVEGTQVHLRPSIHKLEEKAGGQKWLVAWRGDSGAGWVRNSPRLRTKTACRSVWSTEDTVWELPTWASSCGHGTQVTAKSQSLTSQAWCAFLLGSSGAPLEGPSPAQEAEMGSSSSTAHSLLEVFKSLAFFLSLLLKRKFKMQLARESQASFSFPCLEGKRKAASLLRPSQVPGCSLHPCLQLCAHPRTRGPLWAPQWGLSLGPGDLFLLRIRKWDPKVSSYSQVSYLLDSFQQASSLSCICGHSNSPWLPLTAHITDGRGSAVVRYFLAVMSLESDSDWPDSKTQVSSTQPSLLPLFWFPRVPH